MAFDTLSAFLAMGGYGLYVWLSWGLTLLALSLSLVLPLRRRKALLAELERQRRRARREAADTHTKS